MMKTILELKGRVAGKEHTCIAEFPCEPDGVFKENTLESIFRQNTGFVPENLEIKNIQVQRDIQTPGGAKTVTAGFTTNSIELAVREGNRLKQRDEKSLFSEFLRGLPTPDDLHDAAVSALKEGDAAKAMTAVVLCKELFSLLVPEWMAEKAAEGMLASAISEAEAEKVDGGGSSISKENLN